MPSSSKLLFLALTAALISSCYSGIDKCATDPSYSYRVCNAIRSYLQIRSPCDTVEIIKLQRRITLLRSALRSLQRERTSVANTGPSIDCNGTVYRNKCYFILDEESQKSMMNFQKAQNACHTHQGRLAAIGNKGLYDFIYDFIEKNAQDFTKKARSLVIAWTGASYIDRQIYLPDNSTSDFAEWSIYHPTNATERNKIAIAVAANPQVRGMFDAIPTMSLYPLCEKNVPS